MYLLIYSCFLLNDIASFDSRVNKYIWYFSRLRFKLFAGLVVFVVLFTLFSSCLQSQSTDKTLIHIYNLFHFLSKFNDFMLVSDLYILLFFEIALILVTIFG